MKIFSITLLILITGCSNHTYPKDEGIFRLGTLYKSNHFGTSHKYNEKHQGIFGEIRVNDDYWIGLINYTNSQYKNSNAIYTGTLFDRGDYDWLKIGTQWGLVTGYPMDPAPYIGLTFTIDIFKNAKFRFGVLPGVVGNQPYIEWGHK